MITYYLRHTSAVCAYLQTRHEQAATVFRGLLRRNPTLDIVRVRDVGLSGADDPSVLQWAADQGRILITHEISTLANMPSIGLRQVSRCQGSSM